MALPAHELEALQRGDYVKRLHMILEQPALIDTYSTADLRRLMKVLVTSYLGICRKMGAEEQTGQPFDFMIALQQCRESVARADAERDAALALVKISSTHPEYEQLLGEYFDLLARNIERGWNRLTTEAV